MEETNTTMTAEEMQGEPAAKENDKLHQMQFEALPEDEKYSGTDSVEELLNKMKKGERI